MAQDPMTTGMNMGTTENAANSLLSSPPLRRR